MSEETNQELLNDVANHMPGTAELLKERFETQATRIAELEGEVKRWKALNNDNAVSAKNNGELFVKAKASVVELREALNYSIKHNCNGCGGNTYHHEDICFIGKALASSTDAGKIKAGWVAEGIRESVSKYLEARCGAHFSDDNVCNTFLGYAGQYEAEAERLTSEAKGGDES